MSTASKRQISPQEYLELERKAEFRSEYYRGEMFTMSGGSPRHSLIKVNLGSELIHQLKGCPYVAYGSDLRIRVSATELYTYPDASVVCGKLEFDDERGDTILNPDLIAEVLSDSTEAYDRGRKFDHYRRLESLREYLLVSQDEPKLEQFSRNDDGTWTLSVFDKMNEEVVLASLGITLSVAEIYDKVDFTTPADVSPDHPS
jgi:Uma2 family endonuclease